MSVSSYSSAASSSSSSSSSSSTSSSSSSSGSTGKFSSSSGASFSSRSTIVEAQPTVRPFGYPVYNYFWIENRSKTINKQKYYWNFKSHHVVWNRPVSKNVPLPIYTNTWAPREQNVSDDEDVAVSDPEDVIRRRRRLEVKKRNRRLAIEEIDDTIQVISIKKTLKSKKMLDTFWKLYRFAGESVADVKKRMLACTENTIKIKSEFDSNYNEYNANDVTEISTLTIKEEPSFNEEDCSVKNSLSLNINNINDSITIIKNEDENEDSDSDPENVSRLIKQEYMMHYEATDQEDDEYDVKKNINQIPDQQMEKDSEDEEDEEDEDDEESINYSIYKDDCKNNTNFENTNDMSENEFDNFEYEYEAPYLEEDFLSVEINEDNDENIVLPIDLVDDDVIVEKVNWTFDKSSETANNSALTCSALTSVYGAPRVKQITSKCLLSSKRKKRTVKTQKKRRIPKLIIKKEPCFDVKSEPESSGAEKPIICDRYGTRTINYNNRPPKVKRSNWQVYTKLSDSSGDESSKDSNYKYKKIKIKTEPNDTKNTAPSRERKDEGALELRNWFPKARGRKRKKARSESESSWCESISSGCTSVDEFDLRLVRMKKEKRASSSEKEGKHSVFENSFMKTPIKMEIDQESSSAQQPTDSEIPGSLTLPAKPVVDLSVVKAEVTSDLEEQSFAIKVKEHAASDADHSDSSSDTSHSSSRSSCSRSSSSSSSSSSDSDSVDGTSIKVEAEHEFEI